MKKARLVSVEYFKKQKLSQISPSCNTKQHCIEDVKSNICDTNNTEDETTWLCHESTNETKSDLESGGKSDEKPSLDEALPRTKAAISMQGTQKKISWKQEGEDRLRGSYVKWSVSILRRRKKSAQELEKEVSKIYNITALWQHNHDLTSISNASTPEKLAYSSDLSIVDKPNQVVSLSQILSDCTSPKSKWEIQKEQRINKLQDLIKLLQLVINQEKKYREQLSTHSDFYQQYVIVQQFF